MSKNILDKSQEDLRVVENTGKMYIKVSILLTFLLALIGLFYFISTNHTLSVKRMYLDSVYKITFNNDQLSLNKDNYEINGIKNIKYIFYPGNLISQKEIFKFSQIKTMEITKKCLNTGGIPDVKVDLSKDQQKALLKYICKDSGAGSSEAGYVIVKPIDINSENGNKLAFSYIVTSLVESKEANNITLFLEDIFKKADNLSFDIKNDL